MKMKLKYLGWMLSSCLCFSSANAQDFHLSQYDAAALNFNPALTGAFKGNLRLHGHIRDQWSQVANKPFRTGLLSADMAKNSWGFGLQVANLRAGVGDYNVLSLLASVSYDMGLDADNYHHISLGVQAGGFQKSVQFDQLTFGNQYSTQNGGYFNTAIPSGENYLDNSILQHDLNAGFMYYYGKENSKINPFLGGSVFHITQPTETFFNADNPIPMRWVLAAGTKVNLTSRLQVLPKVFYMGQENARELTYSGHVHYYLPQNDAFLIGGVTMRNKDAAIAEAGVKWSSWIFRLSYDVNTSQLNTVSNGRGGMEMSLTYILSKYDPNPIKTCPRL
jgi:type IX secretion system PorP/SprF family membrane protein